MLRSRSMVALTASEVISSLGSLMTVVALPWFVLETTGSPERMGIVLAAEGAPLALFAVPSSRLAGRLGARRTLLLCDAVWVPAVAAIPVLHYAGALSFPLLLGLAFVAGVPWAARYGSQSALLPEILGEDTARLAQANAIFQSLSRLTYFLGPALGGVLVALVGAPTVLLIDAATFAVSFVIVAAFVNPTFRAAGPAATAPTAGGGLRFIRRDPVLRPITAAQVISQASFMGMIAAVPVLAFAAYDRNAALAGILLGAWGAGAVGGSVVAFRLVQSHAALRLGAIAWVLQAVPLWLLVITPGPALALCRAGPVGLWQRRPGPAHRRGGHEPNPAAGARGDADRLERAGARRRLRRPPAGRPRSREPRSRCGLRRGGGHPDGGRGAGGQAGVSSWGGAGGRGRADGALKPELRGWDSNPHRDLNRVPLCRLSYPGMPKWVIRPSDSAWVG